MGFFTDAYDLFSIPVVTGLLGRLYYQKPGATAPGTLPINVNAAVNAVALCGTLAGQLFFGWLGKHSVNADSLDVILTHSSCDEVLNDHVIVP